MQRSDRMSFVLLERTSGGGVELSRDEDCTMGLFVVSYNAVTRKCLLCVLCAREEDIKRDMALM
jgi:hypothetical protein